MTKRTSEAIIVDFCIQHGIWFDSGELAQVVRRLKRREAAKTRARILAAQGASRRDARWESLFEGRGLGQ